METETISYYKGETMKGLGKELKEFILRGNVVDMAVGVIIAGAFGAIVTSLVKDIINPIFGYLLAGVDFNKLKVVLAAATETTEEIAITYGAMINAIINFVLIAVVLFFVLKGISKLKRKKVEEPAAPAGPSDNELLAQILDELKKSHQ